MNRRWARIALHAAGAGAFFFLFQYYTLKAELESSIRWAIAMAVFAGLLAFQQTAK